MATTTTSTTPAGTTSSSVVSPLCGGDGTKFDIVFLFDDSGSQSASDFTNQINFFKAIADELYIGTDYINVGAIKVHSTAHREFGLTDHLNNVDLAAALDNVVQRGGSSAYENGLDEAYNNIIVPNRRTGAVGVVISVTDDSSADGSTTLSYVSSAQSAGDIFIVVADGNWIPDAATDPSYFWRVGSTSDLAMLVPYIVNILCPYECGAPPDGGTDIISSYTSTLYGNLVAYHCGVYGKNIDPAPFSFICNVTGWAGIPTNFSFSCIDTECGRGGALYDVVFLLDESSSMDATEFEDQIYFFQNISQQLYVGSDSARIAAVGASSSIRELFNFTAYSYASEVITALSRTASQDGSNDYEGGIQYAYQTLIQNNGRAGATGVVIGLTDDGSADSTTVQNLATTATSAGDLFIVISHGTSNQQAATDPGHYFQTTTSSQFADHVVDVMAIICPPNCSIPADVEFATVNYTSTLYGDSASYTCDIGYTPSTAATSVDCLITGSWDVPGFTCDPYDCGIPPPVSDSTMNYTLTVYGENATYTCDANFVLNGTTSEITCTENGWSAATFSCEPFDCGSPPSVSQSTVSYTLTTYGSVATYTCDTGYETTAGDTSITCGATSWDTPNFTCNIKDCGLPPVISFGSANYNITEYNSTASYTCDHGYNASSTDTSILCLDTGMWDAVGFTCDPKDCSAPPTVTNAQPMYTLTTYGNNVTYSCDTGYNSSSTDMEITCLANGWSQINFNCDPIDCGNPPDVNHSAADNVTSTTYLSTVTYTCDTGYNPSIPITPITCLDTGWSAVGFTCDPNDCGTPNIILNGQSSYTATTYGNTVTYTCDFGYVLTGSNSGEITCGEISWSNINFTCELYDCGSPPMVNNSVSVVTLTTFGSTVIYSCDSGYNASVSTFDITCNITGWGVTNHTCDEIDCGLPPSVAKATASYTLTTYQSNATYTCDLGWITSIQQAVVYCRESSWDQPTFECVRNDCDEIGIMYQDPSTLAENNDTETGQMYLLLDDVYQIGCVGVIGNWEFVPMTTGFVYFMVWRPHDSTSYSFVGQNAVLVTDTSSLFNFSVPVTDRIAVMPGDRIGWFSPSTPMIPYGNCTPADPGCPQRTRKRSGYDGYQSGNIVAWLNEPAIQNQAYALKIYTSNNTALNFTKSLYNATIADHSIIDRAVTTLYLEGKDFAEEVTYTLVAENSSLDYFKVDTKFGTVKVKSLLPRSRTVSKYVYNVTAVDAGGNIALTELVINTFNAPPHFNNLPSKTTILETLGSYEHVYTIGVMDFTNDDICCTLENVRPQTLNFELLLINSSLQIHTTRNAKFVFEDFNSYQITICCEDTEGGATNGILQVDVKEVKEQEPYTPPQWFIGSIVISCIPLAIMWILSWSFILYNMMTT